MTKKEFLEQLEYRLRNLPNNDVQDAIEYYDGYLSDAGDNEAAAIALLGSPGEVAAQILADYVVKKIPAYESRKTREIKESRESKGRGIKTVWSVILAIFAVPIGLPVAIAVAATAISLLVALFAVILSFGVGGIAAIIGGAVYLIATPFVMIQHMGFAMTVAGCGLAGLGLGILMVKSASVMLRGGLSFIGRFVGKRIIGKKSMDRTIIDRKIMSSEGGIYNGQ